jgi:hypothetical protein
MAKVLNEYGLPSAIRITAYSKVQTIIKTREVIYRSVLFTSLLHEKSFIPFILEIFKTRLNATRSDAVNQSIE